MTGKNKVFDPELELEDLDGFELEPHHQAERHYEGQGSKPGPAFAGFSGGSFYQVDAIDKKAVYASPDQPVKPVYDPVEPVFDDPVVIEEKQFFDPTLNRGKATKSTKSHLTESRSANKSFTTIFSWTTVNRE